MSRLGASVAVGLVSALATICLAIAIVVIYFAIAVDVTPFRYTGF